MEAWCACEMVVMNHCSLLNAVMMALCAECEVMMVLRAGCEAMMVSRAGCEAMMALCAECEAMMVLRAGCEAMMALCAGCEAMMELCAEREAMMALCACVERRVAVAVVKAKGSESGLMDVESEVPCLHHHQASYHVHSQWENCVYDDSNQVLEVGRFPLGMGLSREPTASSGLLTGCAIQYPLR